MTGLSLGTVSNYLNGKTLREANSSKIEEAIKKTNYIPNNIGRYLRSGNTKTVGIVASDISAPYISESIKILENELSAKGYQVLFCNSHNNLASEKANLNFLIQQSISTIIIFPISYLKQDFENVFKSGIPFIVCDSECSNSTGFYHSNTYNNENLAFEATELLIKEGHKNIACICGNKDHYSTITRLNGYLKALSQYNIPISNNNVYYCDFNNDKSFEATKNILKCSPETTACLITTNNMLVGFIEAIKFNTNNKKLSYVTFSYEDYYRTLDTKPTYVMHDYFDFGNNILNLVETVLFEENNNTSIKIRSKSKLIIGDSHKLQAN